VQAHADPGAHDLAIDDAFERLYRTYVCDVYRYSLAVLRNPADAEDITQTTFLNAYRAYRRGEEPRQPRHWLIAIAHNACRSRHLRAVRRPQEVPFEEAIAAIPVPADETPKLEELLEALGRLPFNQRAALVMRELEGRSYAEIADTLEVSVAAVETLIFRARRAVRRDRSLLGVLGSVQLPPSLGSFFGGGGGGAVAGGGIALGSGLLVKAALFVAAGVVAGAIGPVVGASVTHHSRPAGIALSPLILRSTPVARVASAPAAMRVLRGPMVVVKRQGRTYVVTEGAAGTSAAGIELGSGTAPAATQLAGASLQDGAPAPVGAEAAPAGVVGAPAGAAGVPSTGSAAQTVTTTAESATTQVTDAVSSATSTASAAVSEPAPVPTTTVAVPPPPPLPVDTSPITSALPTVTLPQLP
jgi:RNA polymerase sigma factor (sigma-70 family)